MITSLRRKITIALVGLALALAPTLFAPTALAADPNIGGNLACGAEFKLDPGGTCTPEAGADRIQSIIELIVNLLSVLVGIVAVIMIIWGGFKYITSGGDSGNLTTARNTIIYAVIGLVIVALAQFLVQFVLKQVI